MIRSLNLAHLEVFRAVVRTGSLTRAAEALGISQPGVTAQVKALERVCGLTLLERLPRGVRPTHAGEVVAAFAERQAALSRELQRAVLDLQGLRRGQLLLGASTTLGEYLLPPLMGAFHARYPGVTLQLVIANSSQIVARVLGHELDVGFVGEVATQPELTVRRWLEDELVPIVSPRHALATQPALRVSDLAAAAWIAREAGSATRRAAQETATAAGVALVPVMELGSNEAIKRAVAAGLGFGIISRRAITAEVAAGHLLVLDVAGWLCRRQLAICYRRDRSLDPIERAFLAGL